MLPLAITSWRRFGTEFAASNKRVVTKAGVIARKTSEYKNEKIEPVQLNEGLLGRFLGYATVTVTGTGGKALKLKNVIQSTRVKSIIEERADV